MTPAKTKQMIARNEEIAVNGVPSVTTMDSMFIEPNVFSNTVQDTPNYYNLNGVFETDRYTMLTSGYIYDKTHGILDNVNSTINLSVNDSCYIVTSYITDDVFYYLEKSTDAILVSKLVIATDLSTKKITIAKRTIFRSTSLYSSTGAMRLYGTRDYLAIIVASSPNTITYIELDSLRTAAYTVNNIYSMVVTTPSFYFAKENENILIFYSNVRGRSQNSSSLNYTAKAFFEYNRLELNISTGQLISSLSNQSISLGSQYAQYGVHAGYVYAYMGGLCRTHNMIVALVYYYYMLYQNSEQTSSKLTMTAPIAQLIHFTPSGVTLLPTKKTLAKAPVLRDGLMDMNKRQITFFDSEGTWNGVPSAIFVGIDDFSVSFLTSPTAFGITAYNFQSIKNYGYLALSTAGNDYKINWNIFMPFNNEKKTLSPLYSTYRQINACVLPSSVNNGSINMVSSLVCVPCSHYFNGSSIGVVPFASLIDFSKPLTRTIRGIQKEEG